MDRFSDCTAAFREASGRAREMISLFDALEMLRKDDKNEDALRAAWIQAVSSFDFFVHELVVLEATYRFSSCVSTRNLQLPMEIAVMVNSAERSDAFAAHIRQSNSYKAFVAPDRLAEVLSCFTLNPWEKIEVEYNQANGEKKEANELKRSLKQIWDRRNKIAHEADINPTLSGTQLWPLYKEDAEFTIDFVERLGVCLPRVISTSL